MSTIRIEQLSDNELLETRICDLDLDLRKTNLMRGINQLYFELNSKLINFLPHVWAADDWFSPDGVAGFAIPFYLTHPRLISLEKHYIGFVEGTTFKSLMKLLRHETGHAIDNAFHLRKNKTRQKVFGLSSKAYPKTYLPNPNDKRYVRNLNDFYAQAHPDEDWAETFAVWLNPNENWQKKYEDWPVLEKIKLLDNILANIKHKKQLCLNQKEISCAKKDTRTLKDYFVQKRKDLNINRSKPIFQKIDHRFLPYVIEHKNEIRKTLIKQKNLNAFIVNKFLKDLHKECKSHKIPLKYHSSTNKSLLEQQLIRASKEYLKQGRHRIVM